MNLFARSSLFLLLTSVTYIASGEQIPDAREIERRGRETKERMQREQCSWTSVQYMLREEHADQSIKVRCLHAPDCWRMEFYHVVDGRQLHFLSVISKGGYWYVAEDGHKRKYKPYFAPFEMPSANAFLQKTFPVFIDDADSDTLRNFDEFRDGIAYYEPGVPDASKRQLGVMIASIDYLIERAKEAQDSRLPKMLAQRARLVSLRDVKNRTAVDPQTGLIVAELNRRHHIEDFRFRDDIAPRLLAIDESEWEDYTADLCDADRDDLAVFSHAGMWEPGMPQLDTSACVVNVRTKEIRRIPYHYGIAESGCLSPDKQKAYVTGQVPSEGVIRPFEIDLKTGNHRALGENLLLFANSVKAKLSSDGKKLAVLSLVAGGDILKPQLVVIDIASGKAMALNEPMDLAWHSWLPDSDGLICLKREYEDDDLLGANPTLYVCRIGFDGKLMKLRKGDRPYVLAKQRRIMFRNEEEERIWYTCDFDGKDARPFGVEFRGCDFPAQSPNGNRLLMMKVMDNVHTPQMIDMETMTVKSLKLPAGWWAWPNW